MEDISSEMKRKEKREYIRKEVMSTSEVLEFLGFSRVRLHQLLDKGVLEQISYSLYLKDDILAYKQAFDEARANNKWLKDFK